MLLTHLDRIAEVLKSEYTDGMRARGGSYVHWRPGRRWNEVWMKAAELCVKEGFHPSDHVAALLDLVSRPWPNMLLGPRAERRTKSYLRNVALRLRWRLLSQLARLRGRLLAGEDLAAALRGRNGGFSPAFCYTLAKKFSLTDVAKDLREAARRELLLQPRLQLLLAEYLEVPMEVVGGFDHNAAGSVGDPSTAG